MRPAFTAEPLTNTLFVATAVVWALSELQQALRRRSNAAQNDRYSLIIVRVCISTAVFSAVLSLRVSPTAFGFNPLTFSIGLALMWSGIALRWWSFWTLGRYFTFSVMTSHDQPVITSGPYLHLRRSRCPRSA